MNDAVECRTCLGQFTNQPLVSVENSIIDQKSILQVIQDIAAIEVTENDVFPKQICQVCFHSLESAAIFRNQVIHSHITLKSRHEYELQDPLFISCDNVQEISKFHRENHIKQDKEKGNEKEKNVIKEEPLAVDLPVEENGQSYNGRQDSKKVRRITPSDVEKSDSDWNDFNHENASSEDAFNVKPVKKTDQQKKSSGKITAVKPRRKKRKLKRPLKEISDTSSDNDSDVPLEELRKEIKYVCSKAESKAKRKRDKTDDADGPRLCPICGKLFKARQNFNSHMTTVHRKKPEKPDKISCLCPDCGRVITGTRQNFVAHRRYHHSDKAQVKKRFTCDICPRKFYREKNLIIHQRIHKGEKGYVCELCPDKSYTQIGGLILHRRKVHLKKPTCTCNYCGKQFYEKHYLETHIRQWHTGERPFSCEICGKAFSCNGTLLRHRKDSHGEKKPCPKCGKMYTEGELRKHLKRHKIREEGIKRKKFTCEYCRTEMNFTSRKRHLLKQHGIMLRGRGENAERVPITRADAM